MIRDQPIPFSDLVSPHRELEDDLIAHFRQTLSSGRFIGGPMVEGFEQDFAKFCDSGYCIGVGSGTDALRFALMAAGVQRNDIVLTVPNTFIATTEAITQAGGIPAFADVDPRTYTLAPVELLRYLEGQCQKDDATGRTIHRNSKRPVTAVIPVHLYGLMADMDPIQEIAESYHLTIIEDACQAHGAEYFSKKENRWRKAGSIGHAAAFSFYPGKNLGACGEAGAVTTNDTKIAEKVRMLRDHGQSRKYVHEIEGYNGRLDAVQAGILGVKLKHLPEWTEARRRKAQIYNGLMKDLNGVILPVETPSSRAVHHLYVIRTSQRDALRTYLAEQNIATGLHYPVPLHLQKAYQALDYGPGDFPVSETLSREALSLPLYPELTGPQQERIVKTITEFLSKE